MPDVSTPSPKMAAMAADIELARTLMGGTAAMRAAGTRYLPRWPNEAQAKEHACFLREIGRAHV